MNSERNHNTSIHVGRDGLFGPGGGSPRRRKSGKLSDVKTRERDYREHDSNR